MKAISCVCFLAWMVSCPPAGAWTRPGHMVGAAITYEELRRSEPAIIDRIVALMQQHPDRSAFEVAIGRTSGEERSKRIFLEMARWPDDVRGGMHDHPTWHYSARPLIDEAMPLEQRPPGARAEGSAVEAFSLNLSVASDARASAAERAVALCWLFHLIGDVHQPLHAASWFSSQFPAGDHGGSLQFVLDPQTLQPVTLHWYWDDSVSRDGSPDAAIARSADLMQRWPRGRFEELRDFSQPDEFVAWARESYALAQSTVYGGVHAASNAVTATKLPADYVERSTLVAEQRLTLSGYRLTQVLRRIFAPELSSKRHEK